MNTININKTEAPNSYEFGKAGNRFKLYFENGSDLTVKLAELQAMGLINIEDLKVNLLKGGEEEHD